MNQSQNDLMIFFLLGIRIKILTDFDDNSLGYASDAIVGPLIDSCVAVALDFVVTYSPCDVRLQIAVSFDSNAEYVVVDELNYESCLAYLFFQSKREMRNNSKLKRETISGFSMFW